MEPKEVGRAVELDTPADPVRTRQRVADDTPGIAMKDGVADGASVATGSGLLAGTRLWTLEGEIPVQFLAAGDRIITRDSGMARLLSITSQQATCVTVRIKAGSLGHTRPGADLVLPAHQPVLVRDWRARALFGADQVMVPVSRLVDGQFVTLGGRETLRLIALRFERPHVLYADGIEIACATPAPLPAA